VASLPFRSCPDLFRASTKIGEKGYEWPVDAHGSSPWAESPEPGHEGIKG
jgi:hypothetical protein